MHAPTSIASPKTITWADRSASRTCSCGKRVKECAIWGRVLERLTGCIEDRLSAMKALETKVAGAERLLEKSSGEKASRGLLAFIRQDFGIGKP